MSANAYPNPHWYPQHESRSSAEMRTSSPEWMQILSDIASTAPKAWQQRFKINKNCVMKICATNDKHIPSVVWDPHQQCDIYNLEQLQRRCGDFSQGDSKEMTVWQRWWQNWSAIHSNSVVSWQDIYNILRECTEFWGRISTICFL